MTAKWKWVFWIAGALLLAVVASLIFIENRGGHYPIYKASGFSHLTPPSASTASTGEPVVHISAGTLRGTNVGFAISFRGIPYALPPVGELRWQPPQPPPSWQGVREALHPGSACSQRASGLAPFFARWPKRMAQNLSSVPLNRPKIVFILMFGFQSGR